MVTRWLPWVLRPKLNSMRISWNSTKKKILNWDHALSSVLARLVARLPRQHQLVEIWLATWNRLTTTHTHLTSTFLFTWSILARINLLWIAVKIKREGCWGRGVFFDKGEILSHSEVHETKRWGNLPARYFTVITRLGAFQHIEKMKQNAIFYKQAPVA